jgi:hypothetical protein
MINEGVIDFRNQRKYLRDYINGLYTKYLSKKGMASGYDQISWYDVWTILNKENGTDINFLGKERYCNDDT